MRNIGINELERKNDSSTLEVITWSIALIILIMCILFGGSLLAQSYKLDCSIAEFHPDYSAQQKQQCRALRKAAK
jgi:hypothetical protein